LWEGVGEGYMRVRGSGEGVGRGRGGLGRGREGVGEGYGREWGGLQEIYRRVVRLWFHTMGDILQKRGMQGEGKRHGMCGE
jgi:hypothetical protein